MALVYSNSVVLPQSPFLSPIINTTTKLRTTASSSTAINAHASSSSLITRHAVMNRAIYKPSLNICSLIKHLGQKKSSSFSSTSLVVKSLKNGRETANSSVAVPPPAPADLKSEEDDDSLITRTSSNSYHFPVTAVLPLQTHEKESSSSSSTTTTTTYTVVDAPLVPLVSHDVLKRSDFPVDFKFGAGSSAQQIEGISGRGPNTWDYKIPDGIAADSVHKYKEDIETLKMMGADVYRFSISWARIMKDGTGEINEEGINYYNDLIHELLKNGIAPFVTLFHSDEPAALHQAYGGFTNPKIVDDFAHYAGICFQHFGDKVQHWVTFNEPDIWSQLYDSKDVNKSADTNYKVAHNILLAHAVASKIYRKMYPKSQGGEIGITLNTACFLPNSDLPKDIDAQGRAWDFIIGWFAEPLLNGDYPFIMKTLLGDRLPKFGRYEKELLQGGSTDFIGVNYYAASYVKELHGKNPHLGGYVYSTADMQVELSDKKDGTGSSINSYPQGIRYVLTQMKQRYNNPKIYITENGVQTVRDDNIPIWKDLEDDERIKFIHDHLYYVREALREGVNVNSYFVWSLIDSMEWEKDYKVRMGLSYTDYNNDRARYPKKSAKWLHSFITQTDHNESTSPLKPTPKV